MEPDDCSSDESEDDEDESEDTGRINVNGPWVPRPEGTRIGTTWSILYHLSEDEEWSRAAATIGGEPVEDSTR